ncbi:hypothetical protein RGU12_01070 [Fredinandcohnia sp. QZ13]|nr:hypothetical protein [Fredinandcohnia sp. QZ13]MDR4886135.1 hypothetical protein [Fredinandcohnia sp. QZ13]
MKIRTSIYFCVFIGIIVILNSLIVLYSPFTFVRLVNLILVIVSSGIIG